MVMQVTISVPKKHVGKGGIEIMNCREKKNTFAVCAQCRGNATEFVLQLPDWDHHPEAPDTCPAIPNYVIPRRPGLLERTKTSKMGSTENILKS